MIETEKENFENSKIKMPNNLEGKTKEMKELKQELIVGGSFSLAMLVGGGAVATYGFIKKNGWVMIGGSYIGLEGFGLCLQGIDAAVDYIKNKKENNLYQTCQR